MENKAEEISGKIDRVSIILAIFVAFGISLVLQACMNRVFADLFPTKHISYLGSLALVLCLYFFSKIFSYALVGEYRLFTKGESPKKSEK